MIDDHRSAGAPRPETVEQAHLLKLLRDRGRMSRRELIRVVGGSRSRIYRDIARLEELNLVESDGMGESTGGRPPGAVSLARGLHFVGADVGRATTRVVVTSADLAVLEQVSVPVGADDGPREVLSAVLPAVKALDRDASPGHVGGIGVALPGPVHFLGRGSAVSAITPEWQRFPILDELSNELGCPALGDNAANLAALGEMQAGAARGVDDFLFIDVGSGVGCGIVLHGELHRGGNGNAGDIAHFPTDTGDAACVCGDAGCLVAVFSGEAIARGGRHLALDGRSPSLASILATTGDVSAEDVASAAAGGDRATAHLIREGSRALGRVVATLVGCLNPDMVVIGGGVSAIGHPLLAEIRGVVYSRSKPFATGNLSIVLSELADAASVIGAARLISDFVLGMPHDVAVRHAPSIRRSEGSPVVAHAG